MSMIDLSLDRIHRLQAVLPPYTRPTCHIAGTNGKGSVSALLHSILCHADAPAPLKVARFNSPHLTSIRDSIVMGDKPVSEDDYRRARDHVEALDAAHHIEASPFELLACTALYLFERARADLVVLEVGMGGRLDATNVIPNAAVLVSALTAVDLDHQAFLGNSIASIAWEKACIARPFKPFILGKQTYPEVHSIAKNVVADVRGTLQLAPDVALRPWDERTDGPPPAPDADDPPPGQPVEARLTCFDEPLRALLPLHGAHQLANLGTALGMVSALLTHPACAPFRAAVRLTPASVARGIRAASWPGRLAFHTPTLPGPPPLRVRVLADGAHNPSSARVLADFLAPRLARGPLTLLLGLSHSPPKSPRDTLAPLLALPGRLAVVPLQFSPPDQMPWVHPEPPAVIRGIAAELAPHAEVWEPERRLKPREQLEQALAWAARRQQAEGGLVVVAGSLYLVADLYRILDRLRNT